jgi:hypothetical protein
VTIAGVGRGNPIALDISCRAFPRTFASVETGRPTPLPEPDPWCVLDADQSPSANVCGAMGSLIKKRRKRMRKKKHKKMLKRTRWQRRGK